jgi:hypothetical protein
VLAQPPIVPARRRPDCPIRGGHCRRIGRRSKPSAPASRGMGPSRVTVAGAGHPSSAAASTHTAITPRRPSGGTSAPAAARSTRRPRGRRCDSEPRFAHRGRAIRPTSHDTRDRSRPRWCRVRVPRVEPERPGRRPAAIRRGHRVERRHDRRSRPAHGRDERLERAARVAASARCRGTPAAGPSQDGLERRDAERLELVGRQVATGRPCRADASACHRGSRLPRHHATSDVELEPVAARHVERGEERRDGVLRAAPPVAAMRERRPSRRGSATQPTRAGPTARE